MSLTDELLFLFGPLARTVNDGWKDLLREIAWEPDNIAGLPEAALAQKFADCATAVKSFAEDNPDDSADPWTVLLAVPAIVTSLNDVPSALADASGLPSELMKLPDDVMAFLVDRYGNERHPVVYGLMRLLGLALRADDGSPVQAIGGSTSGQVLRHEYSKPQLTLAHWETLLTDPKRALQALYGGAVGLTTQASANELSDRLMPRLGYLVQAFGGAASYGEAASQHVALPPEQAELCAHVLNVEVAHAEADGSSLGLNVGLVLLGRDQPAAGLAVVASGLASYSWATRLWSFSLSVGGMGEAAVVTPNGVKLTDGSSLSVSCDIAGQSLGTTGPVAVIGQRDGLRIELGSVDVSIGATGGERAVESIVSVAFKDMALFLVSGRGDGFTNRILPGQSTRVPLGFTIEWSSQRGLRLQGDLGGEGALKGTIAPPAALGPLLVNGVVGELSARGGGAAAAVSTQLSVALGPFAATVSGFGLALDVQLPAHGGNLGPLDLRFTVEPPKAVGLAIDSGAVRGGGFLNFDPAAGQYSGVFDLTLVSTVSVKAIAIITTRNPDGTPGFALLIIITAEGFTPIPLGFGFELTGIGGLLALNRTVNADAVRNGLRDRVVDSVLFPKDPVKNATRLISTLDRIFPLAHDRLVIGPLAEIGWGTPPIVKVRLALLLEIPKPIRAILLATLSALLPNEKAAVVELHVDAIGVLDLGRGELSLDASLHDSRILQATLSGDMALRLNWGDAPTFLLSVGGFHPKYPAPAGLRPLNRLSLSLSAGNPSVRLECYFAITSNSVQFGARLTLSAQIAGFGVDGGAAFDALIQWSPFALDVSLQAWVRITAGGSTLLAATISAEVSGPQPWHVNGTASVSVLFFSVSVHVEFTIGATSAPPPVDTVDVAQAIWTEISQASAWQAALPPAVGSGATLAAPSGAPADAVLIHPLATVSLRQKVAPLDTPISRMGARVPKAGIQSYHVDVSAPSGVSTTSLNGLFARAQFQDVADDAKLTGPSFELLPAGVTLTPATDTQAAQNGVAATDLSFETLDITSFNAPATSAGRAPALAATALIASHDRPAARGTGATVQVPSR